MKNWQRFKLKVKIWFEFAMPILTGYTIILCTLLGLAYLNNKVIEFLIVLISYSITRNVFPVTFHCDKTIHCIAITIAIFSISILVCFSKNITILSGSFFGMFISLLSYFVEELLQHFKQDNKKSKFMENCNKLNIRNADMLYDIIYSNLSDKELSEKYCIEIDTVKHDRWKTKKKFKENNIEL